MNPARAQRQRGRIARRQRFGGRRRAGLKRAMARLRVINHPSPNRGSRNGVAVDMLVLHYPGMASAEAALERLCDPAAEVSAHYLIAEDGTVFRLVPEEARAWHAGVSSWAGATNLNSRSIGIELANPGHDGGLPAFAEPQMAALIALAHHIMGRHGIASHRVLGHSDIAPERKQDPGERFDWARLARAGIGIWPEPAAANPGPPDIPAVQRDLARFGYRIDPTGILDAQTACVLRAFQRHFRPACVDGAADSDTRARLGAVLKAVRVFPAKVDATFAVRKRDKPTT
jgi:N-acetylmuramoyl-L-alanine amidase